MKQLSIGVIAMMLLMPGLLTPDLDSKLNDTATSGDILIVQTSDEPTWRMRPWICVLIPWHPACPKPRG